MARPRSAVRKTRLAQVRLTEEGANAFDSAVKRMGERRSRVLRRAIREIITQTPDLFDDGLKESSMLRFELRAIGRNLNHITRAINSGEGEELQHIEAVTEAVIEQVGRIDQRVSHLRRRWVRVSKAAHGV